MSDALGSTIASPPSILSYVTALEQKVGSGPEMSGLKEAARQLDLAMGNAALPRQEWDALVHDFEKRRDAMKGKLAEALLAGLPIAELHKQLGAANWNRLEGFSAKAQLGPLQLEASCPPIVLHFPNDPAAPPQALVPQPPVHVGGRLDAGVARGGGTLRMLPDGVAGTLGLKLTTFEVTALGSLREVEKTPSFLAVLGVSFVPGIQLGFGFTLSRVGGLVGINRTVEVDALASRLRGGALADVLFAANPLADSNRLLKALEEMFPPRAGRHLVGPTLRVSWLQVGGGALFDVDLGVIVELPGPARIVIAGSARAQLAGSPPLLQLRIDVLGVIDFNERTVAFDATLVDSGALGIFVITGDAAFRLRWGDRPYTVLSLGGFYPGFRPEPANLPPLQRIALALRSPVPLLTLRAEGYFAVTSNTLQLGAHIEASFNLGISAVGFLGLDVLIQFRPFHFTAAFHAGFRVEAGGFTFAGVALEGTIDGPGPIVISGRLTIETFLFDISWHETFTLPGSGGEASAPPIKLLDALRDELHLAHNLRALAGPDAGVVMRPRPQDGEKALVAPLGELAWSQRKAPLETEIERLEGAPLGSPQGVRLVSPARRESQRALFSPGSFTTLSGAEALNRPAFEELDAGAVLGWGTVSAPAPGEAPQPAEMDVFRTLGSATEPEPVTDSGSFLLAPSHVLDLLGDRLRPAAVTSLAPRVTVTGTEPWTSIGEPQSSATAAHQAARIWGGVALAAADSERPVDLRDF